MQLRQVVNKFQFEIEMQAGRCACSQANIHLRRLYELGKCGFCVNYCNINDNYANYTYAIVVVVVVVAVNVIT